MSNPTQQLLDLAAAHQGGVTDYRLHKLSGFAQNTVSKWRVGKAHMSPQAVTRFCDLAGIKDVTRWQALIGAERESGPEGDFYRALRDELTLSTKAGKPPRGGLIDALVRSIAGKAAGILLAGFVALSPSHDARASENTAPARTALPAATSQGLYITLNRRWRRIMRWLVYPFPALVPAHA